MDTPTPILLKMHAALEPQVDLRKEARTVASQFEAIFVQSMVAGMRETADMGVGDGMFGKGPGADTYNHWFDSYMASFLAENGSIGLSDTLMAEFERLGQVPKSEQETKQEEQP